MTEKPPTRDFQKWIPTATIRITKKHNWEFLLCRLHLSLGGWVVRVCVRARARVKSRHVCPPLQRSYVWQTRDTQWPTWERRVNSQLNRYSEKISKRFIDSWTRRPVHIKHIMQHICRSDPRISRARPTRGGLYDIIKHFYYTIESTPICEVYHIQCGTAQMLTCRAFEIAIREMQLQLATYCYWKSLLCFDLLAQRREICLY